MEAADICNDFGNPKNEKDLLGPMVNLIGLLC